MEKSSLNRGSGSGAALLDGLRASFWVIAAFYLLGVWTGKPLSQNLLTDTVAAAAIVGFAMRGWTMLDGKTEFRDRHVSKEDVVGDGPVQEVSSIDRRPDDKV